MSKSKETEEIKTHSKMRSRKKKEDKIEEEVIESTPHKAELLDALSLKQKGIVEIIEIAKKFGVSNFSELGKSDLIQKIIEKSLKEQSADNTENGEGGVRDGGVLDIRANDNAVDGFGFLRSTAYNYLQSPADIYVSPSQIKRFMLKTGDTVFGTVRPPKSGEKYNAVLKLESVNGLHPEAIKDRIHFDNLTPIFPLKKINMETSQSDISTRIVNLLSPIGKGQRGLIVSPPKAGKTILLQQLANAISINHPEIKLIVLLIDERPEEVTDMRDNVKQGVDVLASTFDEQPSRHVQVAEMVIEKAKRLVEAKQDVVILLDSITRLARAYNTVEPSSGKLLSGGVDANALYKPKRFFGAARNIKEGGSLTIIATALIETGSKMDEVIFEEFKGTGNMELVLDRELADRRIFPAINVNRSGTRKEDLLLSPKDLQRIWVLRKMLSELPTTTQAVESLTNRLLRTKNNQEFLDTLNS